MRKLTLFTIFFLLSPLLIYAAEKGKPVFDGRSWKLGWSLSEEGSVSEEYCLKGESIESWSELVTLQFFSGIQKNTNPEAFETTMHASLFSVCPSLKWESLYQAADDRIWKWSIKGCPGQPDQSEIARLKSTDEGFHVWHYAIKKSSIPQDKEEMWLENLKSFTVVKGE